MKKIANDNKQKCYDDNIGMVATSRYPAKYTSETPFETDYPVDIAEFMDSSFRNDRKYKFNYIKEGIEAVVVGNTTTKMAGFIVFKVSDSPFEIFTKTSTTKGIDAGYITPAAFIYPASSTAEKTFYRRHLYDFKVKTGESMPFEAGDVLLSVTYDWFDLSTATEDYYIYGLTRQYDMTDVVDNQFLINLFYGLSDIGLQRAIYSNASVIRSEQILDNED